jgi:hypothetical protein
MHRGSEIGRRYVVNVQSRRYGRLATRFVISLMVANGVPAGIEIDMMLDFEIAVLGFI